MSGRKPKTESRAAEFRQRLVIWQQTPEATRPSLRSLAKELRTSHALLQHYLQSLETRHQRKELEEWRTNMTARGIKVTPAMEKRFLAHLAKFEARLAASQARGEAKLAAWHAKHPGFAEKVHALLERVKGRQLTWAELCGNLPDDSPEVSTAKCLKRASKRHATLQELKGGRGCHRYCNRGAVTIRMMREGRTSRRHWRARGIINRGPGAAKPSRT